MNMRKLRSLLQRPPVPRDLRARLHADWQAQARVRRRRRWPAVAAVAGAALASSLLWRPGAPVPGVIEAAFADLHKAHPPGVAGAPLAWLRDHRLQLPPEVRVVKGKYCDLGGRRTLHLEVAAPGDDVAHLFFYDGELLPPGAARHGRRRDMHWEVRRSGAGLSVLVLRGDAAPPPLERWLGALGASARQI